MTIGDSIRIRRLTLKMTQADLSQKTGIKQPTISAIEKGVNKPSIDTVILLSDAMNCTVSDLIGQTAKTESEPDPMTARLLSAFRQLNTAGRQFLIQQAETVLAQPAFRQENTIQSAI